jgi:simple sugar transport system substrate-binding protein
LNFVFVQHALCTWDPFWCDVESGIQEAATDMAVNVHVWGPDSFDLEQVAALIDHAVAAGPAGLAVTITDLEQLRAPIERAIDAGIPVLAYNVGGGPEADELPYLTYVGMDDEQAGYLSALRLAAMGGTQGVCINHQPSNAALEARCEGFVSAMEVSALPAETLNVTDDPAQSKQMIADYHAANPDTDIFLTVGPNGAQAWYAFLAGSDLVPDAVYHGTFDITEQVASQIREGITLFAVEQQPFMQGYAAVSTLMLKVRYGVNPILPVTPTGPSFVDAEGLDFQADPNRPVNLSFVQSSLCAWDSFWCTVEDGIYQAAADMDVTVNLRGRTSPEDTSMVALIEQAAAEGPDGMAITITDPEQFRDPLRRALGAGIQVLAYNAGAGPLVDQVEYLTYLGMDQFWQYQGGYRGGLRLAELGGNWAVCINHGTEEVDMAARCEGFLAAMDENGIPAEVLPTSTDAAAAQATIADYISTHPETDTVLTLGPAGSTPLYAFLAEAGISPDAIHHATFDLDPTIIDRIRDGTTLFAIDQQPFWQGYGSVQALMLKLRYGIDPVLPVLPTGPSVVDRSNIDAVAELYD